MVHLHFDRVRLDGRHVFRFMAIGQRLVKHRIFRIASRQAIMYLACKEIVYNDTIFAVISLIVLSVE